MASALWLLGFAIGIAFGVACLWVLLDVVRLIRAGWRFVLKQHAKALRGSSWVLGRPGSDRVDVLRGTPGPEVPRPPAHSRQAFGRH